LRTGFFQAGSHLRKRDLLQPFRSQPMSKTLNEKARLATIEYWDGVSETLSRSDNGFYNGFHEGYHQAIKDAAKICAEEWSTGIAMERIRALAEEGK
jgi:hypothetical protein